MRITRPGAESGSSESLALNVDMDLAPFASINPCGYPGLAVTQTRDLGIAADAREIGAELARCLHRMLA